MTRCPMFDPEITELFLFEEVNKAFEDARRQKLMRLKAMFLVSRSTYGVRRDQCKEQLLAGGGVR